MKECPENTGDDLNRKVLDAFLEERKISRDLQLLVDYLLDEKEASHQCEPLEENSQVNEPEITINDLRGKILRELFYELLLNLCRTHPPGTRLPYLVIDGMNNFLEKFNMRIKWNEEGWFHEIIDLEN